MDETSNGGMDSWMSARLGNAIDALTDRALNRPQMGSDPAQAYGVDQNGRIYTLGQVNGQISAQVNTAAPVGSNKLMPWLIIAAVVFFAIESK
jgi:hypothetical protein